MASLWKPLLDSLYLRVYRMFCAAERVSWMLKFLHGAFLPIQVSGLRSFSFPLVASVSSHLPRGRWHSAEHDLFSNRLPFLCAFCLVFTLPSIKLCWSALDLGKASYSFLWQGRPALCTCPCGRPELISSFKFCVLYAYVKSHMPPLCLVHHNIVFIAGI